MLRRAKGRGDEPLPPVLGPIGQAAEVLRVPLLPLQIFWQNLEAVRPWWPIVIPLLGWTFWRSYRRERAEVVRMRAERAVAEREAAAAVRQSRGGLMRRVWGGAAAPPRETGATDA